MTSHPECTLLQQMASTSSCIIYWSLVMDLMEVDNVQVNFSSNVDLTLWDILFLFFDVGDFEVFHSLLVGHTFRTLKIHHWLPLV